jgi:hypothetical protein
MYCKIDGTIVLGLKRKNEKISVANVMINFLKKRPKSGFGFYHQKVSLQVQQNRTKAAFGLKGLNLPLSTLQKDTSHAS